jgi:hypothetical protein
LPITIGKPYPLCWSAQENGKVQEVTQNQVGRKQNDEKKEKKTRNPKTPREKGDYKEKKCFESKIFRRYSGVRKTPH